MKKRAFIISLLLSFTTILLGFIKGFSALGSFVPLIPPIVAISLAFITHEVILSLFVGIFLGAVMTLEPSLAAPFQGFLKTFDTYVVKSISNPDHVSIILFTLFIGGLVELVGRSGGLHGIVIKLSKYAVNSVFAQFYTWLMGILIFFDDYANTLIVGNTMRPITDKFRVSREKLSFIVDATAAPVTSLVIVSTWIGYEIGLIQDVFRAENIPLDPYMSFIYSIPFRFYVIFMLLFIPIIIFAKRDMFSMYKAEKRARTTGEVRKLNNLPQNDVETSIENLDSSTVPKAFNAIIPIVTLIIGVLAGLYYTGHESILKSGGAELAGSASLKDILGNSNSFISLIWASAIASLIAMILIVSQRIMSLGEVIEAWINGAKKMSIAIVILTLAWSLGAVLKDINTAQAVTSLLGDVVSLSWLPLIIFLVSAITAFATGSSWGSMAIIFPLTVPLVFELGASIPAPELEMALYATIGSILSGTVFGDHCSPISDTTIMSSAASSVNHMDHVTTQAPYALLVGAISCIVGYIPAGFGMNPFLSLGCGVIFMVTCVFILGKKVD